MYLSAFSDFRVRDSKHYFMLVSAALLSYNHWSGETLDEASKMSGAGASLAELSYTHAFMGGLYRPSPPQLALLGQHSGIER